MCGIIAYVGTRDVLPILLDGLSRLEYRGYDSAGIATLAGGELEVLKKAGRIAELTRLVNGKTRLPAHQGISHTRWATHGEPFVAAVENGPLSATQFHPEKSGDAGAHVLENWLKQLS